MNGVSGPLLLSVLAALALALSGCGGGGDSGSSTTTTTTPASKSPREVIHVPGWADPKGFPLSAGVKAHGMIYASGMQGLDMKTFKLVPGGASNETTQILLNLKELLHAGGSALENVVACTVSLASLDDYEAMSKAFAAAWPTDPPTRVTTQAALQGKGAVEIQCTAASPPLVRKAVSVHGWPQLSKAFSPAVVGDRMVYVSGMPGMNMSSKKLVEGGVSKETSQALKNIEEALLAANSSLDLVASCEVFLSDMKDFKAMNEAYVDFWNKSHSGKSGAMAARGGLPSRICVQAGLYGTASVEIRCTAAQGSTPGPESKAVKIPGFPTLKDIPLSWGVTAKDMLYVSGMQGWNLTTMGLVAGGVGNETAQTLSNIKLVVEAAGGKMEDIVECEVSLTSLKDATAMNKAYAAFWPHDPPSRVAVQVGGLAKGASVEIKCTAALQPSDWTFFGDVSRAATHSEALPAQLVV